MRRIRNSSGFTLIELSIVIVVLALLTGTVLAAREMLRNQNLRRFTTDANSYITAFYQFKLKYGSIPGDMPNATELWGRADGVAGTGQCASPDSTISVGKATCNGDGDGTLNWYSSAGAMGSLPSHESFRAWQHLAAAGMIVGQYDGVWKTAAGVGVGSAYNSLPATMYGHNGTLSATKVPMGPEIQGKTGYM